MNQKLKQWRSKGMHLPRWLRDFHAQKDVFKTMHEMVQFKPSDLGGQITFAEGQCYVIDCFLWFMARHGYTLQRSSAKIDFESLPVNLKAYGLARDAASAKAIGLTPYVPAETLDGSQTNTPS